MQRHIIVYLANTFSVSIRELSALDEDGLLETAAVLTDPKKVRDLRKMRASCARCKWVSRSSRRKLSNWDFLKLDNKTQAELAPFRKKLKEVKIAAEYLVGRIPSYLLIH